MDYKICLVFFPIFRKTPLFSQFQGPRAPVPKRGVRALVEQCPKVKILQYVQSKIYARYIQILQNKTSYNVTSNLITYLIS